MRNKTQDEEWDLYFAFVKWMSGHTKPSRRRIMKSLKSHEVSGLRVLDVPYTDVVLLTKRRDLNYKEVISLIERALHVELKRRAVVILQPLSKVKKIVNMGEDILKKLEGKT
ncbi:MAG: hypothetical protein DRJ66_04580 [Thermoprotei archaeon]|nr:MAG: hypothetical protein DRJ66_04580 [Thermoprotei archaeon]RLF20191.1 MAG: hypothetical protein DRZ82_03080 [Thermoprotei archaeon]